MTKNKLLKIGIPAAFYTLLVTFLVLYVRSIDFSKLSDISFGWWAIGVATILGLAARFWGVYIWVVLLRSLGAKDVSLSPQLTYVYAKSWLGRYIPGTAPWILGKIYFASRHGISKNKLAVSSLLEGALQIVVGMVLALSLLAFDTRLDIITTEMKLLIVAAIIACLVALTPAVFNRLIALAYKIVKRKTFPVEHYTSAKSTASGFALYVVGAAANSLSLFFIALAVYNNLSYGDIFFVMGAGLLASVVSMLAVFAPSGLGVREGIQLALLSLIMPTEFALVVTVTTRIWSIAADFLFFGIAKAIEQLAPRR